MSKEIVDILGKLNGDMLALQGMEQRLMPPPAPPPPTVEQAAAPAAPPVKPKKEDYDFVKKLAQEIEGLCKNLEDLVDKELKVPPLPGEEPTASGAAAKESGSTHTSASSKK